MTAIFSKENTIDLGETVRRLQEDRAKNARQKQGLSFLSTCPDRSDCLLCQCPLPKVSFRHRSLEFVYCEHCGHIQTRKKPPDNFPSCTPGGTTYSSIYPALSLDEYEKRKDAIYAPKRDWILNFLSKNGRDEKTLGWMEIGCGGGYFLSALEDVGYTKIKGIDQDAMMVKLASEHLSSGVVSQHEKVCTIFDKFTADIYVAFFVFEHLPDPGCLFDRIASLAEGTIVVFSVPVFGFSCILEDVFSDHYARNLDGVVHTQMYTERSIEYALQRAGLRKEEEWVFGQDSEDLWRFFSLKYKTLYPQPLYELMTERLLRGVDDVQSALDYHRLADQRHIIAVKGH